MKFQVQETSKILNAENVERLPKSLNDLETGKIRDYQKLWTILYFYSEFKNFENEFLELS